MRSILVGVSKLFVPQQSGSRVLSLLAFAGVACWSTLTVVMGALAAANAARDVSFLTRSVSLVARSVPGSRPQTLDSGTPPWSSLEFGPLSFLLWILALNVVLVAAVLGVVDIAIVYRNWRRSVAFGVVTLAGPMVALGVSHLGTSHAELPHPSYVAAMAPGLGTVAVAVVALLVAWRLLGVRSSRPSRNE